METAVLWGSKKWVYRDWFLGNVLVISRKHVVVDRTVICLCSKTSRLSTLALQNDKRMEDELRGGKRKIKLVQHQVGFMKMNKSLIRKHRLALFDAKNICKLRSFAGQRQ